MLRKIDNVLVRRKNYMLVHQSELSRVIRTRTRLHIRVRGVLIG